MKQYHNIVTDGGMGDLIGCLVAVDYNIRTFKDINFHVWVPDYLFELAKHLLPSGTTIRPFSKAKAKFRYDIPGRTTEWCTNHTAMRTHPVDYGFHMLSDRHMYDLNEKNYLQIKPDKIDVSEFELPEKYIVLAAAAVEPLRTMPVATANSIIDFALSRGYTPVFLGKEQSKCGFKDFEIKASIIPVDFEKGINLLNKTSLLESAKIMSQAKATIGIDGGLMHLAGCTDAEIICGYTASSPSHVAPIRNGSQSYKFHAIEPDENIHNRYYQTFCGFEKGNFQKPEGWQEIIANMTAEKFIKVLETLLT